jgi:hypothetical protein
MKKLLIAAAVAAIAGVPSITGLVGNASFSQSLPVQVPAGARTIDDHGRHAEPGDDRGRHAEPGDDRGRHAEPGAATAPRGSGDGGSRHGAHDGSADR